MSLFASRRNTLTEQRVIGRELETLLGAVEVTGLNAWERAKRVYGAGLAEGESPRDGDRQAQQRRAVRVQRPGLGNSPDSPSPNPSSPSANPVQTPLFEEAA